MGYSVISVGKGVQQEVWIIILQMGITQTSYLSAQTLCQVKFLK